MVPEHSSPYSPRASRPFLSSRVGAYSAIQLQVAQRLLLRRDSLRKIAIDKPQPLRLQSLIVEGVLQSEGNRKRERSPRVRMASRFPLRFR